MCCCILQYTAGLLCVPTSIPHPPPPTRKQVCWHVASVESCVLARVGLKAAQVQCKLRPALSLRRGPPRSHSVWHAHAHVHTRARAAAALALQACGGPGQHPRSLPARNGRSQCRLPLRTPACYGRQASTPCARVQGRSGAVSAMNTAVLSASGRTTRHMRYCPQPYHLVCTCDQRSLPDY